MEPKDPPNQGEAAPPVTDEWGLAIPPVPSWLPTADSGDDMGYTTTDDPDDRW